MATDNPLLTIPTLPNFSDIEADLIMPALDQMLSQQKTNIEEQLDNLLEPDWNNFVAVQEQWNDELEKFWSPISHLNGVRNTPEFREAYNACIPKLTEFSTYLGQNERLYQAYKTLKDSESFKTLNQAQQRVVDNALRDFRLAGVALTGEKKQRFSEIKQRLSELTTQFSNNVLDATQGWHKHLDDVTELKGIPESILGVYKAAAQAKHLSGYVITLDIPSYLPLMQYADNSSLREEMYNAYVTRASELGPNAGKWDNGPLMEEILSLRQEMSALLGFENYAQRSLATKMAETPEQVVAFLKELAEQSLPYAKQDYDELKAYAQSQGAQLNAWDIPYFTEKLRVEKYAISQEELKPYFPANKVIEGMFDITKRLFNIDFVAVDSVDTWHEDVQYFEIVRDDKTIASFYLDLFAREQKRGGAWMADCRSRRRLSDDKLQLPVAFLTCNFTMPTDELPSLLTHNEVTTLFHEFGHGLHHMLTAIDVSAVSGINGVAWDAVELPSQFLENWCWQSEAIPYISSHYETGEPLPAEMLEKMLAAKNFQSGMQMVRQIEFALFDFSLHSDPNITTCKQIQALLDDVREKVSVVPTPDFNRFQHSFSHIFAGGYAAGYYSYKWAEVLSADCFSRFEKEGIFNQETGQSFLHNILERGGSDDAMSLFKAFQGREPSIDALLEHSGLGNDK